MERVTVRTLSRQTASVLDRVEAGETVEVTRGKEVVAKIEAVGRGADLKQEWQAHFEWMKQMRRGRSRPKIDPVDELLRSRRRRNNL